LRGIPVAQDGTASAYWTVEYLPRENAVHTTASGELTSVLVTQKAGDSLQEAAEHGTDKFLGDDLDVQTRLTTLEIYQLPKLHESLGVTPKAKIAVVYSPGSPSARDFEFVETVAINRGFNVRLFATVEEARQWLR
jgi:hypothetical protein